MGVMRVDAKSPHEVHGKLFPLDFSNDSRLPVVICRKISRCFMDIFKVTNLRDVG